MFRLSEPVCALHARRLGPDREVSRVTTDSRAVQPGDLFVALPGERVDGHGFVAAALEAGAAGALVTRADVAGVDAPLLLVEDTRLALGRLGAWWRDRFDLPVVGVTGSNGKTSVKEMVAAILREHAGPEAVLATEGNLNNDLGLPLMLLRLRPTHRYAVLEMGMNHLGEIRVLTGMARPSVAVINNAGTAHIGEVGSRHNIAVAKGEIFEGLAEGGVRVLNADDAFCDYWAGLRPELPVLRFGLDAPAEVSARQELLADGARLWLRLPGGDVEAQLQVPGLHNVRNALAAAAVATALQVPPATIARGLSGYRGTRGRLQPGDGVGGCRVVDDSYNANPDSARAAIAWLAGLPGRRVLVLGDMGELGADGPALHAEVGACARDAGVDALHALGELSRHSVAAFGVGALHHEAPAALVAALREACRPDTTILVKGSRFMRMERVVGALTGGTSAGSDH